MAKNQYIKIIDDLTPLENEQLNAIQDELAKGTRPAGDPDYYQKMYNKFWSNYENRKTKEK